VKTIAEIGRLTKQQPGFDSFDVISQKRQELEQIQKDVEEILNQSPG
jgi:hypothetical protein